METLSDDQRLGHAVRLDGASARVVGVEPVPIADDLAAVDALLHQVVRHRRDLVAGSACAVAGDEDRPRTAVLHETDGDVEASGQVLPGFAVAHLRTEDDDHRRFGCVVDVVDVAGGLARYPHRRGRDDEDRERAEARSDADQSADDPSFPHAAIKPQRQATAGSSPARRSRSPDTRHRPSPNRIQQVSTSTAAPAPCPSKNAVDRTMVPAAPSGSS